MLAILKVYKWHLPNHQSDWAKSWWEVSEQHRYTVIAKIVSFQYPRWPPRCPSWNSSNDISSQTMSDWAKTWWEASECHRDYELLKLFCSDIQDGRHVGHLESVQITSPKSSVRLSQILMGGIGATWIFRIAKIVPFWYPRWPPWWPSWNSSNDILPNLTLNWAETWWEASKLHKDSALLKSFLLAVQDGHQDLGSLLENLKNISAPKP